MRNHTAGSWAQSINGNSAFTVDNASYSITTIGYNSSNEAEDPPTLRRIVIDNTIPTGVILSPSTYYINLMPTISGTATDPDNITQPSLNKAGGANVYIRIKDMNDETYWNGTDFAVLEAASDIETTYATAEIVNWSTATLVNSALQDGKKYKVYFIPKDKAQNKENDENQMVNYEVLYDTTTPDTYIAYPTNMKVLRSLASINGTALDDAGAYIPNLKSDLDRVEIQIYDQANNKYWGGSNFDQGSSSFNVVSDIDSWTYSGVTGVSGRYYILQTRAFDKAGNVQAGFTDTVSSMTFIWDTTPPDSSITQPLDTVKYQPTGLSGINALNGEASDTSLPIIGELLNKVQIHLSYVHDGDTYYWAGANFSSYTVTDETAWQDASGTDTWKYSFSSGDWISDKEYTLKTRAFDEAEPMGVDGGNEQDPWTVHTFIVDGTPPISQVSTPSAGNFMPGGVLSEISGTSYGGASGLEPGAPGLKLRAYYISGTDTWYWTGVVWSSPTAVDLPVDFNASASTETWTYPPVGYNSPDISIHNQE
ncbi:MAG: hypothetical protein KAI33_04555, partial [Elusimicrobiales bacterium]|nr:hypothetical protein [Elusimicrobiales bacterium]